MPSLWRVGSADSAIRRGIRISLLEAAVLGAMFAALETWLVPLLQQRLGATAAYIGWLTIIPQLGMVSLGLVARQLIDLLGGNRRIVLIGSAVQALLMVGLALIAFFPGHGWSAPLALWLAIVFGLIQGVISNAWMSWMGGVIPRSMMGRYLSWRWRIFIALRLAWGFGFAQVLALLPATAGPWGLAAVFLVATASRLGSFALLVHQPLAPHRPTLRGVDSGRGAPGDLSFLGFLASIHRTALGRWTLVWSSLLFGLSVCGPYVAPYLIARAEEGGLELAPRPYWWLINIGVVTRLIVLAPMGHLVDLVGPAAVLRIGVVGIALLPLVWSVTTDLRWLMLSEVLTASAACGAECAIGVLLFSCNRDPLQRVRLIGYHQVVVGLAVVVGSYVGKQLLERFEAEGTAEHLGWPLIDSPFRLLILISIVLRIPAIVLSLSLLPRLRQLAAEETAGLWRLVPGSGVAESIRRGLAGVFRR